LGDTFTRLHDSAARRERFDIELKDMTQASKLVSALKTQGLNSSSWEQRNSTLFFALRLEKIVMSVFLSLSSLITSFSVVTVLVLLFTQKREEIGTLMAIGLSRRRAQRLFTCLGLILALLGMGGGLIF